MKTNYIFKTKIIGKMIFLLLLAFIINSNAQSISSIQPNPVAPGQILSVLGTNLYTTSGISFAGGVSSTATGMFGGTMVTVPIGAMTGLITLTGPGMFLESITVLTVSSSIDVTALSLFPQGRTISSGGSLQSFTNVLPSNATDKSVTWSVLPSNLGSVASDGTFTSNSIAGIVTVTATSVSNPSIMGYNVINITNVDVTSVSLSPSVVTITGGSNQLFTTNVLPSNASDKSVTWSISPSFVGYIASDGTYTTPTTFTGVVTITATSVSNPSITGIAIATIIPYVDVASVGVTPSILTVSGGGSQLFTANILPANATDKSVIWSVSPGFEGFIAPDGTYTSPITFSGVVTITATSISNPSISGIAILYVTPYVPTIISSNYVNIDASGYPQTLNITTGASWTIGSFSGSWFAITPMSGTGNSVITITAAPNYLTQTITGSFQIVAGGQYATVDLSQDASFPGANLTLSESQILIGPGSFIKTIYVNSNPSNWTITGGGMSVSPTSGTNGTSFTVSISPNFGNLQQQYSLSVTNGIITSSFEIAQKALVDPRSLNFSNSGGVQFLEVFTTGLWQVNTINGFTALPLSGIGYGVVTITAAPNYSLNTISGYISISTPSLSSIVGINQDATITGVNSISILPAKSCVDLNDTLIVNATVFPANASDKTLVWSSSNVNLLEFSFQNSSQAFFLSKNNSLVVTVTATSVDGGYTSQAAITLGGCQTTTLCSAVHVGSLAFNNYQNPYVFVSGNYAYVTNYYNKSLDIIDVSNPAIPVSKGSLTHGTDGALLDGPTAVYVSGNYAYVISDFSNSLEIIDISNPIAPLHKGSVANGTIDASLVGLESIYVSGDYAYLVGAGSSLVIIDISNPAVPVYKGKLVDQTGGALLNWPKSVYVSGNYAYVASDIDDALEIVDISNPEAPIHKSSLVNNSLTGVLLDRPLSVHVSGNYAYLASWKSNALEIIDISNPAVPVHKGSITKLVGGDLLDPQSVYVSGNYAYVLTGDKSMQIIDISNPAVPVHVGQLSNNTLTGVLPGNPYAVNVYRNYAYLSYSAGLEIVSLPCATAPRASSIYITPQPLTITVGGSRLLKAHILPSDAIDTCVVWASYPYGKAFIDDSTGLFTAGSITGIVTVTASLMSNPSIYGTAFITVVDAQTPEEYFISIVNSSAQTTVVNGNTIVSWPTVAGVSTYCIQYSTDSTFATNVVTVCGLTSPNYTISGLGSSSGRAQGQTIYWKVGAVDDATGALYWSDVQNTARVLQVAVPSSIDQLQLYPNPSSDLINISGLKTNDEILIYDVHGSIVLKSSSSSISISSLSNGIYVARVGTKSLRFVKQ